MSQNNIIWIFSLCVIILIIPILTFSAKLNPEVNILSSIGPTNCFPNFNIPPSENHDQMEKLYKCEIREIFKPFVDAPIPKVEYYTLDEIRLKNFYSGMELKNSKLFEGRNFNVVYLSPTIEPKTEFILHQASDEKFIDLTDSSSKFEIKNMAPLTPEEMQKGQFGVFIESGNQYALLTEEILDSILGHQTLEQKYAFVQLRHKLLGLNSNIIKQTQSSGEKPLFFIESYKFSNFDGNDLKFNCKEKWSEDLQMKFTNDTVEYYAHESGGTNYQILNIIVNFSGEKPTTKITPVLKCLPDQEPGKNGYPFDTGILC